MHVKSSHPSVLLTAVCVCSGMSRAAGFQAQDSTLPASRLFGQACFSSSSQHPIPPCSLLVTRTDEQMSTQLVIAGKETVTEEAEVTAVVQLSPAVFGRCGACVPAPSVGVYGVAEPALQPHPALQRSGTRYDTQVLP